MKSRGPERASRGASTNVCRRDVSGAAVAPGRARREPTTASGWSLVRRSHLDSRIIHQLSAEFEGEVAELEIQAREAIALKRWMEEIIAEHSGQALEKVSKDMERDHFMTAEEAVQYGIIDRVISHRDPQIAATEGW